MTRVTLTAAALVVLVFIGPSVAAAQGRDVARAYAGLFRAPDAPAVAPRTDAVSEVLSVRLYESIDRESRPGTPAGPLRRREGARAEARLTRLTRRLELAVAGGLQLESGRARRFGFDNQWLELGARVPVTPRFSLTGSQRVAYSPQCVLGTFSASQLPADNNLLTGPGSLTSAQSNMTLGAAFTAEHRVSRRTTLQAALRHDRLAAASCGVPTVDDRVSLRVGRRVSRTTQLWLGGSRAGGSARGLTGASGATLLAEARLEYHPAAWRRTTFRAMAAPGRVMARTGQPGGAVFEAGADVEYRTGATTELGFGYQRQLSFPQGMTRAVPLTTWRGSGTWSVSRALLVSGALARSASAAGVGTGLVSTTGVARADFLVASAPVYVEYAWHDRRGALVPAASAPSERTTGLGFRIGVRIDTGVNRSSRARPS